MKAIVAHSFGPPETLKLEEWPSPSPKAGEVKVRVRSAGLAFVDVLMAAGQHQYKPPLPFIPGNEFAGEILAVGDGVEGFAPGDQVCGGAIGGILAQEITLPAGRVQKLPSGVPLDEAAVLRGSFLTAWYSLVDCARLAAGETVLVLGAGGAVGIAACQVARHLGASVIASASSEAKRQLALQNGASHALDTRAADWRDQLKALTGGRGVDVVVDPVGGEATEPAFRSLAYKGRHLMIGFAAGGIPNIPANLPLLKGASLIGISATLYTEKERVASDAARAKILDLFAAGVLKPAISKVYALEDYVAALQVVASGENAGRIVLRMS
jgi:NADPH2:quinone reductase